MNKIENFINRSAQAGEAESYRIILDLIKLRRKKGLTRNQLAKKINVANTTISRVENFEIKPTLSLILKILSAYDFSLYIEPTPKKVELPLYEKEAIESLADSKTDSKEIASLYKDILSDLEKSISLKVSETDNYLNFIETILSMYCLILKEHSISADVINSVNNYNKYLRLVLSSYYSGQHDMAYQLFKESIEKFIEIQFFIKDISSDLILYRCRTKKEGVKKQSMFHIPFSRRNKVTTQRYSFPGLPCLYLGSSVDVCAIELSKKKNDLEVAEVKFENNSIVVAPKILDLTTIFYVENFENDLERVLKNIPLVLVCSTSIEYKEDKGIGFRQEYIFSQLLLEYILNDSLLNNSETIMGVKYFSTKFNFIASFVNDEHSELEKMCNYVFPTRKTESPTDYCPVLEKCFKIVKTGN